MRMLPRIQGGIQYSEMPYEKMVKGEDDYV